MTPDVLDPYAPQVGMHFWVKTHYRRVVEVIEQMDEERWKVDAYDPREDRVFRMALTITRPSGAPGKLKVERAQIDKPRMTPELRQQIADGVVCAARGHDLTGSLPNGKPALYIGPKGQRACRWCKQEAAERHKAKKATVSV